MLAPATVFVAGVTGRGAVNVSAYASMLRIRLGLGMVRGRVAIDARKRRVVCGNEMAIIADGAMVRNREVRMVERRTKPIRRDPGRVAGDASGWVLRGNVIWHGAAQGLRALPSSRVAAVTIRICRG